MRIINPKDQVYPVSIATHDMTSKEVFRNEIAGGLTIRDHVAIEFMKSMLSNPVLQAVTVNQMMDLAIRHANVFTGKLMETPVGGKIPEGVVTPGITQ